jgi:hypothetical protein
MDAIRWQYQHGVPDESVVSPDTWQHDFAQVSRPGNDRIQLKLFADYASNIPLYSYLHAYLRESRVPLLAVWGVGKRLPEQQQRPLTGITNPDVAGGWRARPLGSRRGRSNASCPTGRRSATWPPRSWPAQPITSRAGVRLSSSPRARLHVSVRYVASAAPTSTREPGPGRSGWQTTPSPGGVVDKGTKASGHESSRSLTRSARSSSVGSPRWAPARGPSLHRSTWRQDDHARAPRRHPLGRGCNPARLRASAPP